MLWPGLAPPYAALFAWLEGRGEKPASSDPAPFRPPMLAHALDEPDLAALDPAEFMAEWKWDGIRVQAVAASDGGGTIGRLYSRTGENISKSFPDLVDALRLPGAIDGELLIMRDRRVQSFNVLQQRLNRKTVTGKLMAEFPAHLRAYDLLADGDEDLRELAFAGRRARLEQFIARLNEPRIDLSPLRFFRDLGRSHRGAKKSGGRRCRRRCRCSRRHHAQKARCALCSGPAEGPVVEMETRSVHRRCRADVRAARPWQAVFVLFRLHVRRLDARRRKATSWCPSAKPISASPTRSCCRSTASCAGIRSTGTDRCARWCTSRMKVWCWKLPSKACSARPGTNPDWRCDSLASADCAGTSRRAEADRLERLETILAQIDAGRG